MLLFYTGSDQPLGIQKLPEKSLGGFISSSIVPNSQLNNLYSTLTKSDIDNDYSVIRILALTNITSSTITGITIYPILPTNPYIDIQLAVVLPFVDSCGNLNFERLSSDTSLPYYADFADYTSSSPLVYSTPLAAGASLGLFILRKINQSNVPNFATNNSNCNDNSCCQPVADIINAYNASDKAAQFTLSVNW
jgi:hypothetical protein